MRRGLAVGALGGALVLVATGCSGEGKSPAVSGAGNAAAALQSATPAKPTVSAAVVSIEPGNGAKDVKPAGALKVSVAGGKLTTVTVTGQDGKEVPGAVTADGLGWAPTAGHLEISSTYKVNARATDASGVAATAESSFSTLTPTKTAGTRDNIDDGQAYGVGMIVSVGFDKAVKDKDAVLKGITVEASDGTVVKGHWFGDTRLDFRPEKYWTPGTKVTVHRRLTSVETAPGVYGGPDKDEPFTIGRSQISTVDLAAHRMTVERDGQPVDTIPITGGKSGFDTWGGAMVVEAMEGTTRMTSNGVTSAGSGDEYDLVVPHAIRLTDSGTYVHGNYWSSSIGSANGSHGCIGVQDVKGGSDSSRAGKFYKSTIVGDVVKVVNSKGDVVSPENGLSGWNVPWGSW
ncbi:L,D-transpeptidase [Kitasatospora sp. Root107]|uniref:L,D-transpeptidase n=1 Tax=Kitasatospora sp. Root107 TaxID=1736424 RepID=UPI0007C6E705|nr:L,D-transpeptidase [Kitasatospora sp. Root107]